jgi:hypothetical protein
MQPIHGRQEKENSQQPAGGECTLPIPILKKKAAATALWRKKQLAFDPFVHRLSASSLNEKKKSLGVGTKR